MSATIRITTETHNMLSELRQTTGMSIQTILERAVDIYRRQQMLMALNAAYAAFQSDEVAWDELEAERHEWDTMHNDSSYSCPSTKSAWIGM